MKRFIFVLAFCFLSLKCFKLEIKPFKVDMSYMEGNPTYEKVYKVCLLYDIKYPEIVSAQAILETGHFKSKNCVKNNNLFGLYDSKNKRFYKFNSWPESVLAYKNKVQYKYKGGDYYKFLDKLGYAEDPNYIDKVKRIQKG